MLLDRLAAMPGVSFVRPKGAFYIMVSIPGLGTPMQAAEFLLDAGLAIVPWDEEHLRISYANSYENLSIAMDRMVTGEPGWQTICVSDTGTGMSEEMRKNALKGYISADKDYWRHGIGLYVCHQIITAHGGKIWLKSKEGEGTQVFFSLPEEES